MNWRRQTDQAILKELGDRIKRRRIHKKLTQKQLAAIAGLNFNTIQKMEYGSPVTTSSLIQAMRALKALEQLDNFLPDLGPSPIQLLEKREKEVQRVRNPKK